MIICEHTLGVKELEYESEKTSTKSLTHELVPILKHGIGVPKHTLQMIKFNALYPPTQWPKSSYITLHKATPNTISHFSNSILRNP
ncbi:hypothetical protein LguiB_026226 [Lonicera macranthoides]